MLLPKKNKIENGQALLLVLVGMSAVLVMALSVISRSITDISLSEKDDESSRAFSAAEAGIEQLLVNTSLPAKTDTTVSGASYNAAVSYLASGANEYLLPKKYKNGEVGTVWFVSHRADGDGFICDASNPCYGPAGPTMNVYWGDQNLTTNPAIEVSVYCDTSATKAATTATPNYSGVRVKRYAFDANAATNYNNFSSAVTTTTYKNNGISFKYTTSSTVPLQVDGCSAGEGSLLFAKIRVLYTTTEEPVAVNVIGDTLPAQARVLESTGKYSNSVRKVQLIQNFKEPFSVFENGIYAPSGLVKDLDP